MIKPKALQPGDTIGVIAPASPMRDESRLDRGIRYLESLGYRVLCSDHLRSRAAYLAGSDDQRLADIHAMFADASVRAIFCSRGGYGSMRLLHRLNYSLVRRNPKIFVGFSDMTALSCALWKRCKLVTFSGAMVGVDMDEFDAESEEFFWRILTSRKKIGVASQSLELLSLRRGRAAGHLVCGNLSMLSSIHGTPFQPQYKKSILLVEDIGEESYRVDRMLSQLELSGALSGSAALSFGQFTIDDTRASNTPARPFIEICSEYTERAAKPAIANVMYGHTRKKLTLPFGLSASIDGSKAVLRLNEAAVV